MASVPPGPHRSSPVPIPAPRTPASRGGDAHGQRSAPPAVLGVPRRRGRGCGGEGSPRRGGEGPPRITSRPPPGTGLGLARVLLRAGRRPEMRPRAPAGLPPLRQPRRLASCQPTLPHTSTPLPVPGWFWRGVGAGWAKVNRGVRVPRACNWAKNNTGSDSCSSADPGLHPARVPRPNRSEWPAACRAGGGPHPLRLPKPSPPPGGHPSPTPCLAA